MSLLTRIRLGLSLAGLLLAVLAVAQNRQPLVIVAMVLLGVSLALRLLQVVQARRAQAANPSDSE